MNKKEALNIILKSAEYYHSDLENRNLLIIYEKNKKINFIETIFHPRNFLHLTGIKIINKQIYSSIQFYKLCLKKKVNINDFSFKQDGTSVLKLQSLFQILQLHTNAKMIGEYNKQKPYLMTNTLIGNIHYCIGFIKENDYYIPNTILKEDIRNITNSQSRIIAIYRKNRQEKQYKEQTYCAKNTSIYKLLLNTKLIDKMYKDNIQKE